MRTSDNYLDAAGALISGFDYDLQLWVKNYIIQDCGHRPEHGCNCLGRTHAGQDIRTSFKKEIKNHD